MFLAFHPDIPGGSPAPSSDPAPVTPPEPVSTPSVDPSLSQDSSSSGGLFGDALRQSQAGQPNGSPPTAPTPTAAPVAAPVPPATPSAVMQQIASLGIDPRQFPDDNAAIQYLVGRAQQYEQIMPYADLGYQLYPKMQAFREWESQQSRQAQAAAPPAAAQPQGFDPAEHFKKAWDLPPYDPSWERLVEFNPQTGMYEAISPAVPYNVVEGVNNYAQAVKAKQRDFFSNPIEKVYNGVKEPLMHEVRTMLQEEIRNQHLAQENMQWEQQYAKYLYRTDANGQVAINPMTGQPDLQPFGQRFIAHAQRLQGGGMRDTRAIRDGAFQLALGELLQAQYQQGLQAPPAMPPGLPQGNAQPAAPAAPPADPRSTFLDNALARAAHNPSAAGASQTPSEPVNVRSMGDLEGMFGRAARAQGVL